MALSQDSSSQGARLLGLSGLPVRPANPWTGSHSDFWQQQNLLIESPAACGRRSRGSQTPVGPVPSCAPSAMVSVAALSQEPFKIMEVIHALGKTSR